MIQFSLAIFLSAFLLFQVQPIIARYILPAFGGSPAVWTACMMFFQVALLCGYLYAHLLANKVPSRRQPIVHLVLLALSFVLLPIGPPDTWAPTATGLQAVQILGLLSLSVGVPFVLISASAPLLQHWFAGVHPGKSPFRLYALSNFGSLIALLSYPTLFEPQFTIDTQATTWSFLYIALAAVCLWCGIAYWKSGDPAKHETRSVAGSVRPVSTLDRVLWVALAACGSTILLAMTNHICQDVAVVPFLWILPLSLYLISFIICFDKDVWYQRPIWITLLVVSLIPMLQLMFEEYTAESQTLVYQVSVFSVVLFACCMVCHGELARRRSAVSHLTTFYLYVALGGALGGVFVNLVAPLIFPGFWELHVALAGTFILAGICVGIDKKVVRKRQDRRAFATAWSLATVVLVVALGMQTRTAGVDAIDIGRGFFGVMIVYETDAQLLDHERNLYHGRIQHGRQLFEDRKQRWPTSYYGVNSGVGITMQRHPKRQSRDPAERGLNVGIVGLGVGTISRYGRELDSIRYYEINPQVEEIAREYFTYLQNTKAETTVVLGDARVSMEREFLESGSNEFDVLVIDAFSGDSIPIHLLTEEAFELYAKHLRPGGILALHVTNLYVDLKDIVRGAAARLDMDAIWIEDYAENWYEDDNDWILVGNNPEFLHSRKMRSLQTRWTTAQPRPIRWTDDFSNLFEVLDWN